MTAGFLSAADYVGEVVGDLADGLVGEDLGVGVGLLDGVGIVGPAGGDGGVAGLLEDFGHRSSSRQQPQAVDEDDGLKAALVGALDLLVSPAVTFWVVSAMDRQP